MVDITEFCQDDWVDIYNNLNDDGHLSKDGKKQLESMKKDLG